MGFLVVGGSTFCAVLGLSLVRRRFPAAVLERNHQVAGFFIGVMGTIYAVLLAFVVSVLWSQYQQASVIATQEANEIGDLSRLIKGFKEPLQSQIRGELITYTKSVIEQEWPDMAKGRENHNSWIALQELWTTFRNIEPQTPRENAIYTEALGRLSSLSDSRRLRLHASHSKVPVVMWALLWGGAATTILFTYFFGAASFRSQALMTASLAALVSFILFLVLVLDRPFAGDIRVPPEAFQRELVRIQSFATE